MIPEPRVVLPPAGVLAWLVPELVAARPRIAGEAGFDLDFTPLRGPQLAEALQRDGATTIEVPDGPRGRALASVLRRRLRQIGGGAEVRLAADPRWESLEVRMARASAEAAGDFVARVAQDGEVTVAAASWPDPEPATHFGDSDLRLLVLRRGPDFAARADRFGRILVSRERGGPHPAWIPWVLDGPDDAWSASGAVTHPAPTLRWLLAGPGDRGEGRAALRRLWRILQPDRYLRFLVLEAAAHSGADPYAQALDARARNLPRPVRRDRAPFLVAVCGTDGSGKSHHVQALASWLRTRGLRTAVERIYRHGVFHDTVTGLCRQSAGDRNLHLWRIERLAKIFDSVKHFQANVATRLEDADVVVFDRYVSTHLAAGSGRILDDSYARELLAGFPAPDLVYLLDVPAETALERIGVRGERTLDENAWMLSRYRERFLEMAGREGFVVLDALAPAEANQERIRRDVARFLAARRQGT